MEPAGEYLGRRGIQPGTRTGQAESRLPSLATNGIIAQWFRANREILIFEETEEVTDYLRPELKPFLELGVNLAFPLILALKLPT